MRLHPIVQRLRSYAKAYERDADSDEEYSHGYADGIDAAASIVEGMAKLLAGAGGEESSR